MLNNIAIPISNYCSLEPYTWVLIRNNRYPSTITWHQIRRRQQRREYGKKESKTKKSYKKRKKRTSSQHFSIIDCLWLRALCYFLNLVCVYIYILIVHVKITWVDSNQTNKRRKKNSFVSLV